MEWTDNLNSIMAYVESHLEGELDTEEISRLALCPFPMFQRVFAIISHVSFTEYVRNRRLSRAAYELQHTKTALSTSRSGSAMSRRMLFQRHSDAS